MVPQFFKNGSTEAKEVVEQLKVLAVLPEVLGWFLAPTWGFTTACNSSTREPNVSFGLLGHFIQMVHRHPCRQSTHAHKKRKNESLGHQHLHIPTWGKQGLSVLEEIVSVLS